MKNIDNERRRMTVILKEMALTTLVDPAIAPTAEAASAALLLSHVAWQKANGDAITFEMYNSVLAEMWQSNPGFWRELKSSDPEGIIEELVRYKKQNYPFDKRKVFSCGIQDGNVRVEWTE